MREYPKLDVDDRDPLRELTERRGWQLLVRELDCALENEHAKLRTEKDPVEIYRTQGRIAGILSVLGRPADMVSRCRKREE